MSEAVENVTENTGTEKQEETKAEKFVRLDKYLINKAIDAIGKLENLANKSDMFNKNISKEYVEKHLIITYKNVKCY